ncbi:hypothetical protein pb186bvf_012281 [Paramecium bursaria]
MQFHSYLSNTISIFLSVNNNQVNQNEDELISSNDEYVQLKLYNKIYNQNMLYTNQDIKYLSSQISIDFREQQLRNIYKEKQKEKEPEIEQNQVKSILRNTIQIIPQSVLFDKKLKNISRDVDFSIEGFLYKKSPHFLQGFQLRFCILQDCKLSYFRLNDQQIIEQNPYGVLNFDVQTYDLEEKKNNYGEVSEFTLSPVGCSKLFIFKADSDYYTNQWALKVHQQLILSKGKKKLLTHLTKGYRFWRNDTFSFQQVFDQADDGDILLFRGKDIVCKGIQLFTKGQFDHVAILFRNGGVPKVLEAVQDGVGFFEWQAMKSKNWYKLYEKVIIRKLKIQRTPSMRQKLLSFIQISLGAEYSFNLNKMFMEVSAIRPNNPQNEGEKRTYFCSELVAKALKEMEVIKTEKSSTQFYPSSFEQGNRIFDEVFTQEYNVDFVQ